MSVSKSKAKCKLNNDRKSHLKIQNAVLHGRKTFQCKKCGTVFWQKDHLKNHSLIHTGEKPFECDICGNSFNRMSNLTAHKRIHTGKPYKCAECGKAFNHKLALGDHERIHTGVKPYKCDECGKTFGRNWYLVSHKKVHEAKSIKCDKCGKEFRKKCYLRNHMKRYQKEHAKENQPEGKSENFNCTSKIRLGRLQFSETPDESIEEVAETDFQSHLQSIIKVEPEDMEENTTLEQHHLNEIFEWECVIKTESSEDLEDLVN